MLFEIVRMNRTVLEVITEKVSKIFSNSKTYVPTGVLKSNVIELVEQLKEENVIDDYKLTDSISRGVILITKDTESFHALLNYLTENLIKDVDWGIEKVDKDMCIVLYYAFS